MSNWDERNDLYSTKGAPEDESRVDFTNRKIEENTCLRMYFIWPTKRLVQFVSWCKDTEQNERARIAQAVFTGLWEDGARPPIKEPIKWTIWLGHGESS